VTVIRKLKAHFARYGIPETVVSDNGPQYSATEFAKFAREFDFENVTSSPVHAQANGKAESAVKSAKIMLKKAKEAGRDPYLALLDVRNTPLQNIGSNPVQLQMSRRSRSTLPMVKRLLQPQSVDQEQVKRGQKAGMQARQEEHYNKHARDLPALKEGDCVRRKPFNKVDRVWM